MFVSFECRGQNCWLENYFEKNYFFDLQKNFHGLVIHRVVATINIGLINTIQNPNYQVLEQHTFNLTKYYQDLWLNA